MLNPIALRGSLNRLGLTARATRRAFGTTSQRLSASAPPNAPALNPRWLSELQARIKRCAALGLEARQRDELKALQETVDAEWLDLLGGREGFLTGPGWRGLDSHTVTWGDQVSHVNNVVYNKYAEAARFNWLRNFAAKDPEHRDEWTDLMTPRGIGLIMRSIKTDYKFPMGFPDNVTVLHKLVAKPTYESDYILLEGLLISENHRRPAARCFEDIVVYDYRTAKRTQLKLFMVDRLRDAYDAQETSRARCEERVNGLIEAVERIEKSA
ncbi:hypothetical protein CCHL11_07206 [Colletotrichum chlorophyti]|uniref:Thioesterase domain-containing protein n=1 Tax=Colletotrichum chlorophyti TaxID=708187 RepID=A0A1Q8RXD3_9PEZI|nr:hypothetical protein CCHL11_07206 [Colletotrichum chlorophyti]